MPRNRRVLAVALVLVLFGASAIVFAAVVHKGKSDKGAINPSPTGTVAPNGTIQTKAIKNLAADQFGISTGVQLYTEKTDKISPDIAGIAGVGAHWMRTAIRWDLVEPNSASSDDWTKADLIVGDAQKQGLTLILNITGTPPWARAPGAGTVEFPPDLHTYATFAGKMAARYKGKVYAYELGNEPNHTKSFARPDPQLYEQVLQDSYPLIKAGDPNVLVLTGGLGGIKDKDGIVPGNVYLADLYKDGAKPYFDGVSYHPYTYPQLPSSDSAKPGWTNMLSARQTMVDNGDSAKKIFVTEYGAPTGGPNSVNEDQQAAIMYDAYRLWATYSWAGPLCWFDYRDKGTDTSDHGNFFGLYTKSGEQKVAVRQYQALVQSAR